MDRQRLRVNVISLQYDFPGHMLFSSPVEIVHLSVNSHLADLAICTILLLSTT